MSSGQAGYIPAPSPSRLTPVTHWLLASVIPERRLRHRVLDQARLYECFNALDVNCGAGDLSFLIKQRYPSMAVVGVDPDDASLNLARARAEGTLSPRFEQCRNDALPYPGNSFDRVFSSFSVHRLDNRQKSRFFAEAFRVLKYQGELHLVDLGPPRGPWARLMQGWVQRWRHADDNLLGNLHPMARAAGFRGLDILGYSETLIGTVYFYRAIKAF